MKWEIRMHTLCDGYVNTWSTIDEQGNSEPETFNAKAEAQAALDEFLAEIQEEIDIGIRAPDEGYSRDEFQIVQVLR